MADSKSRLANFWYYYKVHTIVAVALAAVLAICVAQCAAKPKYDYSVTLYMSKPISESATDIIAENLAQFGTDLNGDGKTLVEIINCSYGDNDTVRMNQIGKLQARLTMTESILFIVDDTCFSSLDSQGLFADCGLDSKDGKALNLGSTPLDDAVFAENGQCMPENYYLCPRSIIGTSFEGNADAIEQQTYSGELLEKLVAAYK